MYKVEWRMFYKGGALESSEVVFLDRVIEINMILEE